MIAKIGHGSKLYGALLYNNAKVLQNNAEILHLQNMIETPDGNYTTVQLMVSFLPNLIANKKTEKTAIHISLNPDPSDIVTDDNYINIANDYMKKMGYAEQPYVVFKHNDIDRSHIHIVSTTVSKTGTKISDKFEKKRSMDICREIEKKYGLTPATEKNNTNTAAIFQPVDHKKGDIKSQIASVVRYLPQYYGFQTLGTYNALLSLFNITAEYVKKEYSNEIKEGLVYFALDEEGNKITNGFKSSLFGKKAGLLALKSHFEKSKNSPPEIKARTIQVLIQVLKMTNNENDFRNYLIQQGVNMVIRRNEQGRLYGITFIDHYSHSVFNGSQLGKQFSANTFHELFSQSGLKESRPAPKIIETKNENNALSESRSELQIHPFFDFMVTTGMLTSDLGLLNVFLFDPSAEDPEEQLFEFNMKKKRRKPKPRY